MSDRGGLLSGTGLQQIDTDIQALTKAVNRIATALEALVPPVFTVTGSRASGAALESLLADLVATGRAVDNTTP